MKAIARRLKFFLPILGMGLLFMKEASADCHMTKDDSFQMFISSDSKNWGVFNNILQTVPATSIYDCQEDAGKYLMVSLGITRGSMNSDVQDISQDGIYYNDYCQITNSPWEEPRSFEVRKAVLQSQYRAIRSCMYMRIQDGAGRPLTYNKDQKFCKITALPNNGGVVAEGDYCFFRINPDSLFLITPVIRDECLQPEYLTQHGINPQDLELALNSYVVGDDSGVSTQINAIGSRAGRLYIQPYSQTLPLNEDDGLGSPRFQKEYDVDIHMGNVRIVPRDDSTIDISYLVSNASARSCYKEQCSSPSDFMQPVAGEVEFYRLNGSKKELVDNWWQGSVASANWQGFLRGTTRTLYGETFPKGQRYRIITTFRDPYDDYDILISNYAQFLIDARADNGVAGLDVMPVLAALQKLNLLPAVAGLPGLGLPGQDVGMSEVLKKLQEMIHTRVWPSFYNRMCDTSRNSCMNVGIKNYYTRLIFDFTVGDRNPMDGSLMLRDMTVQRDRPVGGSYRTTWKEMPSLVCDRP